MSKYMSWEEFGKLATADLAYDDDACDRISESLYDRQVKIGTICQQAEQIKSLCDGIDKVNNEAVKHRRENKRLKADMAEEIRISIKVSNEKLAENQRLKELLCRAKKYADIQREYELVEEIEQALAAQPQKGVSDE